MPEFKKRSNLTVEEIEILSLRFKEKFPVAFDALRRPVDQDNPLYEGSTAGLYAFLMQDKAFVQNKSRLEISAIRFDILNYLADESRPQL